MKVTLFASLSTPLKQPVQIKNRSIHRKRERMIGITATIMFVLVISIGFLEPKAAAQSDKYSKMAADKSETRPCISRSFIAFCGWIVRIISNAKVSLSLPPRTLVGGFHSSEPLLHSLLLLPYSNP